MRFYANKIQPHYCPLDMVISIAVQVTAWCDYVNTYDLAVKDHTIMRSWIIHNLSLFLKKTSDFKKDPLSGSRRGGDSWDFLFKFYKQINWKIGTSFLLLLNWPDFWLPLFCFLAHQSLRLVESPKCAFKICSLRHGSFWCLVKLLLITGLSAVMIFLIYTF